jgi:hypothetical protein
MEHSKLTLILCIGWLLLWAVGAGLIIVASLLRCPRCGRWHNGKDCHED